MKKLSPKKRIPIIVLLILAVPFFASAKSKTPVAAEKIDFVRIASIVDTQKSTLQTAIVEYAHPQLAGQIILVGAVHVADPPYYHNLNALLQSYDKVCYELVGDPKGLSDPSARQNDPTLTALSMLQELLKNTLGLAAQLEMVDYSPKHFVHADMTPKEFRLEQSQRNESFLSLYQEISAQMLNNPPNPNEQLGMVDLIMLFTSNNRQAVLRNMLARQMILGMKYSPKETVIIDGRNRKAIDKAVQVLGKKKQSVAVFYGAAHLDGMDEILREKYGFIRGQQDWLNAWEF